MTLKRALLGLLVVGSVTAEPLEEARQAQLDDLARHQRNALRGEQVLELNANGQPFLALALEQRTATPQGGILLLHDQGHHPDWPRRLRQAREFLPDKGWNTLSIALPLLNGPVTADAAEANRILEHIAAGMQRLNQDGQFNIVLLGYGEGAYWAARYMAERLQPQQEVGYALMMVDATPDRPDLPELVGALAMPVLDLYHDDDDWVSSRARERRSAAARANREGFTQIRDARDGSFHTGPTPGRTTRRLWGWLRQNAAGREGQVREQAQ